ncbi:MAG: hypothetical protein IID12_08310 [Candidatus Marinimicrobia bacterium]|nr:hypothetical protein [Candidatus Neomarinimicrobiota bacterium]
MNEKFWTFIKIIAAVIATVLIYNFMNKGILSEFIEPSIVESSMDKLHEILMSRTREADAKENLDKIFEEFSEKVAGGEIAPEEVEDIASSILNLRMVVNPDFDAEIRRIIVGIERAHENVDFSAASKQAISIKLDSIAIRIEELSAFQEENLSELIGIDRWSEPLITGGRVAQLSQEDEQVVLEYLHVNPVEVAPLAPIERKESELTIIGTLPVSLPPIKITKKLHIIIDSSRMSKMDSVKLRKLEYSLKNLKLIKTIRLKRKSEKPSDSSKVAPVD